MVCEGQSLAGSDAALARDLRLWIRTEIAAGKHPDRIKQDLRKRYGDSILLAPPVSGYHWALWLSPLLMLLCGALLLYRYLYRNAER